MQRIYPILIACLIQLCLACTSLPPPMVDKVPPPQAAPMTPPAAPLVAPPVPEEKPVIPVAPPVITQQVINQDEELFLRGFQQLALQLDKQDQDGGPAKLIFERLINTYPTSKWHGAAQVCIRLLGAMDAYRDQLRTEQAMAAKVLSDKAKSLQETEQLKRELRSLMEKHQAELTALQQENEQLRKDIQLLKNLELQRDRREKMLR